MPAPNGHAELNSWKEIADFLGVTVRTAQRWEETRGLPVRRLPGEYSRVSAVTSELIAWKQANTSRASRWRPRVLILGALGLLVLLTMVFAVTALRRPVPISYRLEPNVLTIFDSRGRELWRRVFPAPVNTQPDVSQKPPIVFDDIDGDGRIETLYFSRPLTVYPGCSALICYGDRGEEKWRFTPAQRVRTRTEDFAPPYLVAALAILGKGNQKRIVVSSHHHLYYPNQVALLSNDGRLLSEYWHSGHLPTIELFDLDGDGRDDIVVGGTDNARNNATVVVLDSDRVAGAAAEGNADYQILGFPPAREKLRLLYPGSCMSRQIGRAFVARFAREPSALTTILEGNGAQAGPFCRLRSVLRVEHCLLPDGFRLMHERLRLAGQLDHALTPEEEASLEPVALKSP